MDAGARYALFLDFDGTLVEIAPRPDAVVVPDGLGATLVRLRSRLEGALAIVTGRPIATIDDFLEPQRFDVAGLHGVERRLGHVVEGCRPEAHPTLRAAVATMRERASPLEGILIEDKGCSVALHWRLAPEGDARVAADLMEGFARDLAPAYRLQRGKAVAELLPTTATKGHAIRGFLREAAYAGRRPVFFGDDLTDEEAFADVNAEGGVAVRIGPGPTIAGRRLPAPADVRAALTAWADGAAVDPLALPAA